MPILYAVAYSIGSYAREDAATASIGGIYTDAKLAKTHAMLVHGTVVPVELDVMPPGIVANARELGLYLGQL